MNSNLKKNYIKHLRHCHINGCQIEFYGQQLKIISYTINCKDDTIKHTFYLANNSVIVIDIG